uniref:Uncharacterized protein n=1 Tax=Aegilops tauschii subsp. strangulata TaxID=200361 RepID=A0A453RT12_AEGTS
DGSEGLSFAFRVTDAAISAQNEEVKDGEETQLYPKKGMEQQASYLIKGFS